MFKWILKLFKKREVVYCKDCRWCFPAYEQEGRKDIDNPIWYFAKCLSPHHFNKAKKEYHDLILVADGELKAVETGKEQEYCMLSRKYMCGSRGRWFESKGD